MADAEVEHSPPRPLDVPWLSKFARLDWAGLDELHDAHEVVDAIVDGSPGCNSSVSVLSLRGSPSPSRRIGRSRPGSGHLEAPHDNGEGGKVVEARFVAKRAVPQGPALDVAMLQRWYQRERGFYAEVAPALAEGGADGDGDADGRGGARPSALQVPRCAVLGPDACGDAGENFLLVLEYLGAPEWRTVDPELGCADAEALAAVAALAGMHGGFLARPERLDACRWLPRTPVHIELGDMIQDYYAGAWAQVRPRLELPAAVVSMCEALCGSYASLLRRMAEPPVTLVHGDFRLENLRFGAGPQGGSGRLPVAAFDWQFCCKARGAYDLAYFICLAMPPKERRSREPGLRRAYADGLCAAAGDGRANEALAELEADLCVSLLLIIASFVMGAATCPPSTEEMHQRSLRWLSAAALDWNAGRMLPPPGDRSGGALPAVGVACAM